MAKKKKKAKKKLGSKKKAAKKTIKKKAKKTSTKQKLNINAPDVLEVSGYEPSDSLENDPFDQEQLEF